MSRSRDAAVRRKVFTQAWELAAYSERPGKVIGRIALELRTAKGWKRAPGWGQEVEFESLTGMNACGQALTLLLQAAEDGAVGVTEDGRLVVVCGGCLRRVKKRRKRSDDE